MKRNIFSKCLYGILGLGLLASCSNEPLLDGGGVIESETTAFVRIALVGDMLGSRAGEGDFENGTDETGEAGSIDESAIRSILLTFFDKDRKYVGQTTVSVNKGGDKLEDPVSPDNTVEKYLTFVAPVNLPEGTSEPAWVVAYVNPTSAATDLVTYDKLDYHTNIIRTRESVSPAGYRTMNNSVYYDQQKGYTRYATPVNFKTQFFDSESEAKNNMNTEKTIEITVERMEAKVRVSGKDGASVKDIKAEPVSAPVGNDSKVYTLTFHPQAWFVNGTEKRSFLIKNYRSDKNNYTGSAAPTTIPSNDSQHDAFCLSYDALKSAFSNPFNSADTRSEEINNQTYKRSYWAIDPTYFTNADGADLYPEVSYDVKYVENGVTVNTNGKTYPLTYRSYKNVVDEWNKATSTSYVKFNDSKQKKCEYVLENTMSLQTLQSEDALASMSSVVLVGYYTVEDGDRNEVFNGSEPVANQKNAFYVRHEESKVGEADYKYIVMVGDDEAIDNFLEKHNNLLYVQQYAEDGTATGEFTLLKAEHLNKDVYGVKHSDFKLVYPKKDVAGTTLSEQWRTLDLVTDDNGAPTGDIYIYDNEKKGHRKIEKGDMQYVRTTLYSQCRAVERFDGGKAYFNVPLKHIWGNKNSSNVFNASTTVLGDYGVVRNHIYDLTINKIQGLGTGIGDITQPIVPPTEIKQYYIAAKLNILKWRLVSQSVDL